MAIAQDSEDTTGAVARGAVRLVFEAVDQATRIVEGMHANIAALPAPFDGRPRERASGIAGFVYGGIRWVAGATGAMVDAPLGLLGTSGQAGPQGDGLRSALNGVIGDHLHATQNPLAIPMRLRAGGVVLRLERGALAAALPAASGRIVLLAHGLCMSDRQWARNRHDHGAALARETGCTPVYLHYNSGRHVSDNGRLLAALLEELIAAWPRPVEELSILAHSMGGLVARSAHHYAVADRLAWPRHLRRLVFLGTPHHGAPLERAGHRFHSTVGISPYLASLARLGRLRSAGITDLRHGNLVDEDWHGADRFEHHDDRRRLLPLPADVECYAVAATLAGRLGRLGDGLVPVASALGEHDDPARALHFPESRRWVGAGLGHLDLLEGPDVYAVIRRWLAA
ncbi:MAG: lipase family alpha/beta hydrolase [Candidatus Binatia bacterium]